MFRRKFGSEFTRGLSPVIGVILLVAITLILSVAVGVFLFDIGNNTNQSATAGINVDEQNSETIVRLNDMGTAETVYIVDDNGRDNLTVGKSHTTSGEWVVIGVTESGSKTVITKSENWSGDPSNVTNTTNTTVSVIEVPETLNSPDGFNKSEYSGSTASRSSDNYPIGISNNTSIVEAYTTQPVNTSDNIDELDVGVKYDVNSGGGSGAYINYYYDGATSRDGYVFYSGNTTKTIDVSSASNTTLSYYPGLYNDVNNNNFTLKQLEITAYNVSTTEENFPTYFTTDSDFTTYRTGNGVATVSGDSIQFSSSQPDNSRYQYKKINTSDSELDDVKVTTNITQASSVVYLYVYDETGTRIGYQSIASSPSNNTVSILDAISSSELDSNSELQLAFSRYQGDTTISDVTINGYKYSTVTSSWDTNLTTDAELSDGSIDRQTNATIQNDNVSIDGNNNKVWTTQWLNNTDDIDGYAVETEFSGDALNIETRVTDNYDYNSTSYAGIETLFSGSEVAHMNEYVTPSFTSLNAYNGASLKFESSGSNTEVDYISITPYNYTNSTNFEKSTQSELESADWDNTTVSVSSGTVTISPGSDDNTNDYIMNNNNLSVNDNSQVLGVIVTGSNLNGPTFSIGKDTNSYSVSTSNHKGNDTYRYAEFNPSNATRNSGPVTIGIKQSETEDITIDSVKVITRN